jgi:hypothetical protein
MTMDMKEKWENTADSILQKNESDSIETDERYQQ